MARRDEWVADDIVFEDDASTTLRPYLLTGGRTQTSVDGVEFETLVERVADTDLTGLRFESAKVLQLCTTSLSVAEISAHMSIPLGSTIVLVGDLIASGHLLSHRTHNAELDSSAGLLARIIAGVKQL